MVRRGRASSGCLRRGGWAPQSAHRGTQQLPASLIWGGLMASEASRVHTPAPLRWGGLMLTSEANRAYTRYTRGLIQWESGDTHSLTRTRQHTRVAQLPAPLRWGGLRKPAASRAHTRCTRQRGQWGSERHHSLTQARADMRARHAARPVGLSKTGPQGRGTHVRRLRLTSRSGYDY